MHRLQLWVPSLFSFDAFYFNIKGIVTLQLGFKIKSSFFWRVFEYF